MERLLLAVAEPHPETQPYLWYNQLPMDILFEVLMFQLYLGQYLPPHPIWSIETNQGGWKKPDRVIIVVKISGWLL